MMCQCGFTDCNKWTTLLVDIDNDEVTYVSRAGSI